MAWHPVVGTATVKLKIDEGPLLLDMPLNAVFIVHGMIPTGSFARGSRIFSTDFNVQPVFPRLTVKSATPADRASDGQTYLQVRRERQLYTVGFLAEGSLQPYFLFRENDQPMP